MQFWEATLFGSHAKINVFWIFLKQSGPKEGACSVESRKNFKNVVFNIWGNLFPFLAHYMTVDNNLLSWMFFSWLNSKIRLCSRDIWTYYVTLKWTHYARYTTAFISWFCIYFIFQEVPSFLGWDHVQQSKKWKLNVGISIMHCNIIFFSHIAVIIKMLEKSYNFILDHNNPQLLIEFLHVRFLPAMKDD